MDLGRPPILAEVQKECERDKGNKRKQPKHEEEDEVKIEVEVFIYIQKHLDKWDGYYKGGCDKILLLDNNIPSRVLHGGWNA